MKEKSSSNKIIDVYLTEEESCLFLLPAGSNFIYGINDPLLKQIYLQQKLSDEDIQAFLSGEITCNLRQTLDDVDLSVSDVDFQYSRDLRTNLVRVLQ